jgi:glycosyltransferase involved in cell wall biosynthesis
VTDPLVTVVITTRDRPDRLPRAVASALGQTHPAVEAIVVDDGSSPPARTPADPRLRTIRLDPPQGACRARNAGLAAARGAWITFLDDDDELPRGAVAAALEAAGASTLAPPVGVLGAALVVGDDGSVRRFRGGGPRLPKGSGACLAPGGRVALGNTLFLPTEVLRAVGGFDQAAHPWEHTELLLRLDPVCSLQPTEKVLYQMTEHDGPRQSRLLDGDPIARILSAHPAAFARARRARARYAAAAGKAYLRQGRWGSAVRWMTRALLDARFDPRVAWWWLASLATPAAVLLKGRANGSGPNRMTRSGPARRRTS